MSRIKLEDFRIPLDEIKLGTDNFSAENYIGGGGFGKVYRAKLLDSRSHSLVAVKRLDPNSLQGKHEFLNEVSMLFSYQHQNIITFIGYCDEGNEMIVVYEYAVNQSLDKYLCDTDKMSSMSWEQRLKICIGAAKGLNYLHFGLGEHHRVIHRDVKSGNILLDENWVAKISDFGLSKIGPKDVPYTHLHTRVAGTFGYCDPNYHGIDVLRKESDAYSFGVVLFEMLCGRLVYKKRWKEDDEPQSLLEWVRCHKDGVEKIIDPHIKDQIKPKSLGMFKEIAYRCLKINVNKRPTMIIVVQKLEEALEFQKLIPNRPFLIMERSSRASGGSGGNRALNMWNGGEAEKSMACFGLSPTCELKIQKGDITLWFVNGSSDAIVSPANERMLGGGGADGAIHRAAGPKLLAACYKIPEVHHGVRCRTGKARITPGFKLPVAHVIHAVGPIYNVDGNPAASLANAYKNSLRVARKNNIQYVAFPAISCGLYGYPFDEAATVAISTIRAHCDHVKEVHFVLFFDDIFNVWLKKAEELLKN